ncbi:MAG: ATP synthase F0 subunit C [Alphaproteobacteria bacterium]|nr:ATP synthase F0 subunit C [Alphaproteobacteria bacterium]
MKLSHWMTLAIVMTAALLVGDTAFAADGAPNERGFIALGAGLAIGLAALGGTLGQGNAARATYESIARNPQASDKIQTPFFIGMALIESLVIVAFVVAFSLVGQLG